MKVLFIYSGNSRDFAIPPFLEAQGQSLSDHGISVDYFRTLGKGINGYLKTINSLRKYLKENKFDLLHAHYTLSGWVAVLSFMRKPLVLSLMGTDAYGEYIGKKRITFKSWMVRILTLFIQIFVNAIISKSAYIERHVYRKKISYILPNGVRLDQFKIHGSETRIELGLENAKRYILFLGDPAYKRKNIRLAQAAVKILEDSDIELLAPYPTSHANVVKYLNAADVFISTAFMEGSSNIIKEAMACNCPIVSTDAGDARWVIGKTQGCYITSFDHIDVADKLKSALEFARLFGRTKGRERILELGLDSASVAESVATVYKKVLKKTD